MARICTAMSQYVYRLGVVGILLACVLQVIGFSTEFWVIDGLSSSHHGLWRNCSCAINCVCGTIIEHHVDAWFIAVQVLETVGLAGLVLASCCAMLRLARRKTIAHCLSYIILCVSIAGVCIAIGDLIFGYLIFGINGTQPDDTLHLGYSSLLCCCSGVIAIIGALLVCMDTRQPMNTGDPNVVGEAGFTELADPIDVGDRRYLMPIDSPGYTPPPAYEQEPPPYEQQPPLYDQQPPAYDQQPPRYDQQPPRYDQKAV